MAFDTNIGLMKFETEPLRSVAFGAIGAAYSAIGTGLEFAGVKLYILNYTDAFLLISDDGATDKYPLPPNAFLLLDVRTSQSWIPVGRVYSVKHNGVAPTTGAVYVSSSYEG